MMWESDNEVYESIGHFSVEFEQVCRSMEHCIRNILDKEGLTNPSIHEIVLAGMTAEPLLTLLQRLVGETMLKTDQEKAASSKVFSYLKELTEERNDLIHSKWYFFGMETKEGAEELRVLGEKLHANKQGTATKRLSLDKDKLNELIERCREATVRIALLTRCVIGVRSFSECFEVQNKELVVRYEALIPIQIK